MLITIVTNENKWLEFDTDIAIQYGYGSSTEIFKLAEKLFWVWFNHATANDSEIEEQYFGCDNIYSKKGAVLKIIESLAEYVLDTPEKTRYSEKEIMASDIEATLG